jgi:hypothetical protein
VDRAVLGQCVPHVERHPLAFAQADERAGHRSVNAGRSGAPAINDHFGVADAQFVRVMVRRRFDPAPVGRSPQWNRQQALRCGESCGVGRAPKESAA